MKIDPGEPSTHESHMQPADRRNRSARVTPNQERPPRTDSEQGVENRLPAEALHRSVTRSQVVLQGFRSLRDALVRARDPQSSFETVMANTVFDGERVLSPYARELSQISRGRDLSRLAGLIRNTESNIRAIMGIGVVEETAGWKMAQADGLLQTVVQALRAGGTPDTRVRHERVVDLLS